MSFRAILIFLTFFLGGILFLQQSPFLQTNQEFNSNNVDETELYLKIARIRVISGHEFDILSDDGRRVHGVLQVRTPVDATKRVVQLINNSSYPMVSLLDKEQEKWVIEIHLTHQGQQINLTDWLTNQNLVWDFQ